MAPSRTKQLSLSAILGAAYFVLRSVPTFQMVGVAGRFTAGDMFLTTISLLAGVWAGTLSIIVGTVLAYSMTPPVFFGFDFVPATVNVLVVSLIATNRINWARLIYLVTLLSFVANPYSLAFAYTFVPFVWLHLVAFALLLSPFPTRIHGLMKAGGAKALLAISLLTLIGTTAQHLAGGSLYEISSGVIGGISPAAFANFWRLIFWLYPIERGLIVLFSTMITAAVLKATQAMNLQTSTFERGRG